MKTMYLCNRDCVIDGVKICTSGKSYEIRNAEPTPEQSSDDVAGYCDILGCDNGNTCWTTWLDVEEYFDMSI